MDKVSDEEYIAETRHDELIGSLKAIAERPGVDGLVKEALTVLKAIESKELPPTPTLDIQPLIKELSEGIAKLEKAMSIRPKRFVVHRTKVGLIEKIVPEY